MQDPLQMDILVNTSDEGACVQHIIFLIVYNTIVYNTIVYNTIVYITIVYIQ